ncbi:hypothetical protein EUGRSUZ_B02996 [Eucalyptus grandis]|uniref:Uncharacterized protein n=2 Tax=Eucalyptus grandis TaxID=71139 RepID=A0ACC3LUX9_EUCGR|nr:hypothetical protein EUGRSUZ_B02996 [Eucalyptus grandis]
MLFHALTFLLTIIVAAQPQEDALDGARCPPLTCGGINFSFPFPFSNFPSSGTNPVGCGLSRFQLSCDASGRPVLDLPGTPYRVLALYPNSKERAVTVVNDQLIKDLNDDSCESLQTIPSSGVQIDSLGLPPRWPFNLTFFECDSGIALPREIADAMVVNVSCGEERLYVWWNQSRNQSIRSDYSYGGETPYGCKFVEVPVSDVLNLNSSGFRNMSNEERWSFVLGVMKEGFPLAWSAIPDCENCRRRGGRCGFEAGSRKVVCFCSGCNVVPGFTPLPRAYRAICVDMKERLGEGGYGTVYKGRMPGGRPVAVKILDKSSNNSQDFINEVATIGMIHHVNIIRLLGFCLEGSKRALIYEYMPNGSLGDLLHNEGSKLSLVMEKLLEIAIGVALGIEYLHKGCNSRILHLDIKPHNVLLDENFNPKISDFGLAKIYSRNRSFITMTGARGTVGFIAPEIFMRNLGNPSHKSDVYSFGMLLLEMVGKRKHEEVKGGKSSESYFPGQIYDEINEERAQEFGDLVEEVAVSRKMIMVGLWCIQINPKDRPSMTQVLEMLMGNSKSIPMPPKPQFFSPPRSQVMPGSSSTDVDASSVPLTLDSQET